MGPVIPRREESVQRLYEVFAGFLDHADHHLGRLFSAIGEMGLTDDTMIVVVSDNGAS